MQAIVGSVQSLLSASHRKIPCGLQFVTSKAIATSIGEEAEEVDAAQTQFWGLGRVLGAEQPEFRCRLIDMPDSEGENVSRLAEILVTETTDNQFAIRDGKLFVPRKQPVKTKRGEI